jgi:hypothetical protein
LFGIFLEILTDTDGNFLVHGVKFKNKSLLKNANNTIGKNYYLHYKNDMFLTKKAENVRAVFFVLHCYKRYKWLQGAPMLKKICNTFVTQLFCVTCQICNTFVTEVVTWCYIFVTSFFSQLIKNK